MADFISPYDIREVVFTYLLGGSELLPFFLILVLSLVAAFFRMPAGIFVVILLFGSLLLGYLMGNSIFILVLLVFGIFIFWGISRFVER